MPIEDRRKNFNFPLILISGHNVFLLAFLRIFSLCVVVYFLLPFFLLLKRSDLCPSFVSFRLVLWAPESSSSRLKRNHRVSPVRRLEVGSSRFEWREGGVRESGRARARLIQKKWVRFNSDVTGIDISPPPETSSKWRSIKTWLQKQIPDFELNGLLKSPDRGQ